MPKNNIGLNQSKQLKEIGFPQRTNFYWINVFENLDGEDGCWQIHHISYFGQNSKTYHPISAPTVEEIIETFKYVEIKKEKNGDFSASDGDSEFAGDDLITPLVNLYIWANTS